MVIYEKLVQTIDRGTTIIQRAATVRKMYLNKNVFNFYILCENKTVSTAIYIYKIYAKITALK